MLLHLIPRAREVAFGLSGGLAVLAGLGCKLLSAAWVGRRGGFAVRDFGEDVVGRPDLRRAGVERLLDGQRLLRQLPRFGQPTGLALQEVGEVAESTSTD